jgi:hypothetical protein
MPKCDVNGEVGWFCVVLCFMGSRVIILSMLLDIAQPMGLLPPRPIRVPRCFFLAAVEACVASLPRGDNLPIGVLTFDLLEKVEDLESFDLVDRQEPAEESGLEAVEVERGDWTLGKMRREEVFRPPKPSVNVDVCENNACMAMVLITVFSQLREVEVCGMRGLMEVWIRNAVVGGRARRKRGNAGGQELQWGPFFNAQIGTKCDLLFCAIFSRNFRVAVASSVLRGSQT